MNRIQEFNKYAWSNTAINVIGMSIGRLERKTIEQTNKASNLKIKDVQIINELDKTAWVQTLDLVEKRKAQDSLRDYRNKSPYEFSSLDHSNKAEIINRIRQGEKYDFSGQDLTEENLQGLDLRKVDLRGAIIGNLRGCSLEGCNLENADFSKRQASLNGAKMAGANLKGANLSGLYLENVDMKGILVDQSTIFAEPELGIFAKDVTFGKGTDLSNTDFSDADLRHVSFYNAKLHKAKFSSKTNFDGTCFHKAECREAEFNGADLSNSKGLGETDWTDSYFINCNLQNQSFYNANLTRVNFSGSNMDGTNLYFANLLGADLSNVSSLRGANLSSSILKPHVIPDDIYENLSKKERTNQVKQSESQNFPSTKLPLDLTNVNFCGASLTNRDFTNSILKGASFAEAYLTGATFDPKADFSETNFHFAEGLNNRDYSAMNLQGADFSGVNLSDSIFGSNSLKGVNFGSTQRKQTNLSGVDLTEAQHLDTVNFSGVDLSLVNLPDGFNFSEENYLRAVLEKKPDTWDGDYLDSYLGTYSPEIAIAVSQGATLDSKFAPKIFQAIKKARYSKGRNQIKSQGESTLFPQAIQSTEEKNQALIPIKQRALSLLLNRFPEEILAKYVVEMKYSILSNNFSGEADELVSPQVLFEAALRHPKGEHAQSILWEVINKYLGKNSVNTYELYDKQLIASNKERALIALKSLIQTPEAFYFNIHSHLGQREYVTNTCDLILQSPELFKSLVQGIDSATDTSITSQLNQSLENGRISFDAIRMIKSIPSFAGTSGDQSLETAQAIFTIFKELSLRVYNPTEFSMEIKITPELRIQTNILIGIAKSQLFNKLRESQRPLTVARMEFLKDLIASSNSPSIDSQILEYMQSNHEINDGAYQSALTIIQKRENPEI